MLPRNGVPDLSESLDVQVVEHGAHEMLDGCLFRMCGLAEKRRNIRGNSSAEIGLRRLTEAAVAHARKFENLSAGLREHYQNASQEPRELGGGLLVFAGDLPRTTSDPQE
jgi:hypothetical protein